MLLGGGLEKAVVFKCVCMFFLIVVRFFRQTKKDDWRQSSQWERISAGRTNSTQENTIEKKKRNDKKDNRNKSE